MEKVINGHLKSEKVKDKENKYISIYREYTALMKEKGSMKTGIYKFLCEKYGYSSPQSIKYIIGRGRNIISRERRYAKELETLNN